VIVSYKVWERSGLDRDILTQTVRINRQDFAIVGVSPQHFTGTTAMGAEYYLPVGVHDAEPIDLAYWHCDHGHPPQQESHRVEREHEEFAVVASRSRMQRPDASCEQRHHQHHQQMTLKLRGLIELGGVFLERFVTICHLRVHHARRHHPPRPVLGLHAKRGRERYLQRQRQEQEVEHVTDDEHLHRAHLGFAPPGQKISGELTGPGQQRPEAGEHASIDMRRCLKHLFDEVLHRVVVRLGVLAAIGAIASGHISAAADAVPFGAVDIERDYGRTQNGRQGLRHTLCTYPPTMAPLRAFIGSVGLILGLVFGAPACRGGTDTGVLQPAIEAALQVSPDSDRDLSQLVREWYSSRQYRLAWVDDDDVDAAKTMLQTASNHGLKPEWYGLSRLEALRAERRQARTRDPEGVRVLAAFDVAITTAVMQAGLDVAIGHTQPDAIDKQWKSARTPPDLPSALTAAIEGGRLASWLDDVAPRHTEYGQLRRWLTELRQSPGFAPSDPRADQIAANLERLRWLPDDLGERHLVVNIPEFMLRAREHGRTVLEMRVVVGKANAHETPVLSGDLESVVFNPYWNIPDSIVLAETLPAMARDSDYLERQNMEVIRVAAGSQTSVVDPEEVDWSDPDKLKQLRIRQRPGDGNALGEIKFPFRNQQAIYLHDTPSTALFARDSRAFSHGCVRVAEPEALARYVLSDDPEWTSERIAKTVKAHSELHVEVTRKLPVHLVYLTVVPGPDGGPKYLADVYGFDRKQLALR